MFLFHNRFTTNAEKPSVYAVYSFYGIQEVTGSNPVISTILGTSSTAKALKTLGFQGFLLCPKKIFYFLKFCKIFFYFTIGFTINKRGIHSDAPLLFITLSIPADPQPRSAETGFRQAEPPSLQQPNRPHRTERYYRWSQSHSGQRFSTHEYQPP